MEHQILLKIMVISSIFVVKVFSGVTVEVKLKKFQNYGSQEYQTGTTCGSRSYTKCNTYFQLCIKPSNLLPSDLKDCWYYNDTKANPFYGNDVDFRRVETGMPKTIIIHNDTWPGSFGYCLKVWNHVRSGTNKLIDIHQFRFPFPATPNAGIHILVLSSRGSRPNKPVSTLSFSVRVYCDQFYYGADCLTYCKESDDDMNGHFTCDKSGTPKCRSGWFNLPKCLTNCVPKNDSINGHYTCTNNGTKICKQDWYGPKCLTQCVPKDNDRDGHFICSNNGTRICKKNWYGPKCLTKCVPKNDIVDGHYTCSKNGTRVCIANWYGPKCLVNCVPKNDSTNGHYTCASNGTRICASNWYGTFCLIGCVSKNNSVDGRYSCSKTGARICQNNWYGPKCTVRCVPMSDNKHGHYTCSINGTIVCRPNWYGPKCLTQCVPKDEIVEGHYVCAKNGSRICRGGWFGLPKCLINCVPQDDNTNGHYSCSNNGTKICNSGWYGQRCRTHCVPRIDNKAGYACANDGTRICVKNWTGQWCNISVLISSIRSNTVAIEVKSSRTENLRTSFTLQHASLRKSIFSTVLVRISPTRSTSLATVQKTSNFEDSSTIYPTRHDETYAIQETRFNTRASNLTSPPSTASIASTSSNMPSDAASIISSTIIKSGTPIPGITINKEGDQGIFSWLMNTSKGNMTVIGFGLAFIFFILLVVALVKICRLKRSQMQPRIFVNESLPRHREEINPMYDNVPSRFHDRVNDVPLRKTGNNKANESDDLQMCYGCFGGIPGQSQYAYQKGETGM